MDGLWVFAMNKEPYGRDGPNVAKFPCGIAFGKLSRFSEIFSKLTLFSDSSPGSRARLASEGRGLTWRLKSSRSFGCIAGMLSGTRG